MIHQQDTICAIVTPQGIGGIGVIRISGKDAIAIVSRLFHAKSGRLLTDAKTHTLHYGYITDPQSIENPPPTNPLPFNRMRGGRERGGMGVFSDGKIDEVLVSVTRSPHSFTCEDVVEVGCHGGPFVTNKILEALLKAGARLATPGEFTKRAFLNGRIDLAQAEAVIDIINAKTDEGLRCALWQLEGKLSREINTLHEEITGAIANLEAYIDFPEEDIDIPLNDITGRVESVIKRINRLIDGYYRWRPFREGVLTAIVGRTNVGKSSLLNTLIGEERAIVTPHPGTTRDIVDGMANIHGIPLRLLDTAGIRLALAKDMAEEEGIKRMYRAVDLAELILLVLDASEKLTPEDREILSYTKNKKRIIVISKIDKGVLIGEDLNGQGNRIVYTSATTGDGIEDLKQAIRQAIIGHEIKKEGETIVTNLRHKVALEEARKELYSFLDSVKQKLPLEIQALHLREAMDHIGEITGVVTTEDIIDRIFSEFCIGK